MADMSSNRTLAQLTEVVRCVVRVSDALFGFVYELTPDAQGFTHGKPLPGRVREEEVLRTYFKAMGERALELLAGKSDQAVTVIAPHDPDSERPSWFAVLLTQDLGVPACVVIVYPFYDRDEAVRTLHLVEMIMTTKQLRKRRQSRNEDSEPPDCGKPAALPGV